MTATTLQSELYNFTGTEQYFCRAHSPIRYTDGVKFLLENAPCQWLFDVITSHYVGKAAQKHLLSDNFISVKLKLTKDGGCKVTLEDGNDGVIVAQKIPFTDFPMQEITLYLIDGILLLSSEY